MNKAFILLSLLCLSAWAAVPGLVRVKFAIVDAPGEEAPGSIANRMLDQFKQGKLDVGYTIRNLTIIEGLGNANAAPSVSSSFSLTFVLLAFLLFSQISVKARWIVVFIAALSLAQSTVALGIYENCIVLDGNPQVDFKLHWTVSGNEIRLALDSKAQGYVAMGLSTDGTMPSLNSLGGAGTRGSDMYIGYVNPADPNCVNGCINDYIATVYNTPSLDSQQDSTFVAASKANGRLQVEFTRPLNTGDSVEDRPITPGAVQTVIYSAALNDVPVSSTVFSKHDFPFRGDLGIDFGVPSSCPTPGAVIAEAFLDVDPTTFDQDTFSSSLAQSLGISSSRISVVEIQKFDAPFCPECEIIELKLPTFTIPNVETTYQCFTFPNVASSDKQILRFEPVVDNSLMVHHMVIFQTATQNPASFECSSMPVALPSFAWTPGQSAFNMPPEAGFPVGPTSAVGNNVIIQMHYNNPTFKVGETDASGIRFFVKPRNFPLVQDAGMIFIGVGLTDPKMLIPPGISAWHQQGECTEATLSNLGSTVLNVFGVFHHMHELGRQIILQRIRNGTVVENVSPSLAYDYNDQKTVPYTTTISAGDRLVVHCIFNSQSRSVITTGGEDTDQEMCLTGLLYYPLVGVATCFQNPQNGCEVGTQNCNFVF